MSGTTKEKLALMRYVELLEAEALVVSKPDTLCDQRIEFATDDSRHVRPGALLDCKGLIRPSLGQGEGLRFYGHQGQVDLQLLSAWHSRQRG